MTLKGKGVQALDVPALAFDGEKHSDIYMQDGLLKVSFAGADCIWTSNGKFSDCDSTHPARTGHLRRYQCSANRKLKLKGRIK